MIFNRVLYRSHSFALHRRLDCSAFPARNKLTKRYPILEQVPALLPAVWLHRLGGYGMEVLKSGGKENSPAESVSLGKKRIEMMIKYGIISKDN